MSVTHDMIVDQHQSLMIMLYKLGRPEDCITTLGNVKFLKDDTLHFTLFKAAQACYMLKMYDSGKKLMKRTFDDYVACNNPHPIPSSGFVMTDIDHIMYRNTCHSKIVNLP